MNLEPREGLFCNCMGEGSDLLVMSYDNGTISVCSLEGVDLSSRRDVKSTWITSAFWIEAERKIHFDYVPDELKGKTIFDVYGEDYINDPTPDPYEEPDLELPEDLEEDFIPMMIEETNWPEEHQEYRSTEIIAAYLSKKVLGIVDNTDAFAFGWTFVYTMSCGTMPSLAGWWSYKDAMKSFLNAFPVSDRAKEFFLKSFDEVSERWYEQSLSKSLGEPLEKIQEARNKG